MEVLQTGLSHEYRLVNLYFQTNDATRSLSLNTAISSSGCLASLKLLLGELLPGIVDSTDCDGPVAWFCIKELGKRLGSFKMVSRGSRFSKTMVAESRCSSVFLHVCAIFLKTEQHPKIKWEQSVQAFESPPSLKTPALISFFLTVSVPPLLAKRSLLVKELQSLPASQRVNMLQAMPLSLAEKRSLRWVPVGTHALPFLLINSSWAKSAKIRCTWTWKPCKEPISLQKQLLSSLFCFWLCRQDSSGHSGTLRKPKTTAPLSHCSRLKYYIIIVSPEPHCFLFNLGSFFFSIPVHGQRG